MKNEILSNFKISETESELRIDWNNREIPKSLFLTLFLSIFWLIWTPATLFATCMLFLGGPVVFLSIWLVFGYLGVFGIPVIWSIRRADERVRFDAEAYRHELPGYPRWFQRHWKMSHITQIHYGFYDDEESTPTLSVVRAKSRDIIAYWATPATTYELFKVIKNFHESNNISVTIAVSYTHLTLPTKRIV